MLLGGFYVLLSDGPEDVRRMVRRLYPGLPPRPSLWKALFMPREAKRQHNAHCREQYDLCLRDLQEYTGQFWMDFRLNDDIELIPEGKEALCRMLAARSALEMILKCIMRSPAQWIRYRLQTRGIHGLQAPALRMYVDNSCDHLIAEGIDIGRIVRERCGALPRRLSIWQRFFMPHKAKDERNRRCDALYRKFVREYNRNYLMFLNEHMRCQSRYMSAKAQHHLSLKLAYERAIESVIDNRAMRAWKKKRRMLKKLRWE